MLQGFESIISAIRDWAKSKFQPQGNYSLVENTGYSLGLNIDNDYVMTLELKNADGDVLSTKSIDFPIESMVIGAEYADGVITLALQNGQTLDVDVSALVNGLVNDTFTIAGIDMKDDITKEELVTVLGIGDKLDKNGDASDTTVTFTQTAERENIVSGEKQSIVLGKIKKWLSDLKPVAFSGKTSDLTNDSGFITSEDVTPKKIGALSVEGGEITDDDKSMTVTPNGIHGDDTQILNGFDKVEADKIDGRELLYNDEDTDDRYVKQESVLNTPEEIDANTSEENVAGALTLKSLKSDFANSINQINSNLETLDRVTNAFLLKTGEINSKTEILAEQKSLLIMQVKSRLYGFGADIYWSGIQFTQVSNTDEYRVLALIITNNDRTITFNEYCTGWYCLAPLHNL